MATNKLAVVCLSLLSSQAFAQTPRINPGGVVNGANYAAGVAPGSLVFVHGANLATTAASAPTGRLPTSLNGTQLLINGVPIPLFYVSPDQIDAQVPWESSTGITLRFQVSVNGVSSNTVLAANTANAAGLFTMGSGQGAIVTLDGALAAPSGVFPGSRPVHPGEYISIYATGLGTVSNRPPSGSTAPNQPLSTARNAAFVTVGGAPATATFAGLAPGFVGLYQVNARLAANTPGGDAVPVTVSAYGIYSSNTVTIAVAAPPPSGAAPSELASFTPAAGPVGTTVMLSGEGFTQTTAVEFNGIPATSFTTISDELISAVVPQGAITGPIAVTTLGQSPISTGNFTITPAPAPTITSFTPTSGASTSSDSLPETAVKIAGTGFTGATAVTVNGFLTTFTVISDTSISATVHDGTSSGPLTVTTPGGTATSGTNFTVTTYSANGRPGGVINSIAIDPKNSSNLYVATDIGVFKSLNAGANWIPANAGLVEPILPLAIDPSNPATIYAGTNTIIPNGDPNVAVFKSTDGGVTWGLASNGISPFGYVRALAIDSVDPSTVYMGRVNAGAFKSSDGGTSWVAINNGLTASGTLLAMALAPSNPSSLYAGTRLGGVFKSTDGGANWKASNQGLTNTQVLTLAIAPSDPSRIYAGTFGGVFKSTDAGTSWKSVLPNGQIQALAVNPSNADVLYACADTGVLKSGDGGLNWTKVFSTAAALAIDAADPATIYAGTNGDGMFKSTDGGATWTEINNELRLPAARVDTLAIDPSRPSTIFAGLDQGGGAFKTADAGSTWTAINNGLPSSLFLRAIAIDPMNPSSMFAGTSAGLFRSNNSGSDWTAVSSGVPALASIVPAVAIDPSDSRTIYAGTSSGLFKSTDNGATWNSASPGNFYALVIDPSRPSTIYALGGQGSGGGGVGVGAWKSTDGGVTWAMLNVQNACGATQCAGFMRAIAIDPANPSTIYVGRLRDGMFKSTNGGANFTAINKGLPVPFPGVGALTIDGSKPSTIYAGTDSGVFMSADGGLSWSARNSGLSLLIPGVDALIMDPSNPSILYAGTREGKVFKSTNGGASWQPTGL